jgi:hypothetical protein
MKPCAFGTIANLFIFHAEFPLLSAFALTATALVPVYT